MKSHDNEIQFLAAGYEVYESGKCPVCNRTKLRVTRVEVPVDDKEAVAKLLSFRDAKAVAAPAEWIGEACPQCREAKRFAALRVTNFSLLDIEGDEGETGNLDNEQCVNWLLSSDSDCIEFTREAWAAFCRIIKSRREA